MIESSFDLSPMIESSFDLSPMIESSFDLSAENPEPSQCQRKLSKTHWHLQMTIYSGKWERISINSDDTVLWNGTQNNQLGRNSSHLIATSYTYLHTSVALPPSSSIAEFKDERETPSQVFALHNYMPARKGSQIDIGILNESQLCLELPYTQTITTNNLSLTWNTWTLKGKDTDMRTRETEMPWKQSAAQLCVRGSLI